MVKRLKHVHKLYEDLGTLEAAGRVIGVTRERIRQLLVKGSHLGLFEYKPLEYPFVAKETLITDYRKHLSLGRVAKANGITSGSLGKLLNGIPCNSGCAISDGLFVLTEKEKISHGKCSSRHLRVANQSGRLFHHP